VGYLEKRKLCLQLVKCTRISSRLYVQIEYGQSTSYNDGITKWSIKIIEGKKVTRGKIYRHAATRWLFLISCFLIEFSKHRNLDVGININLSNVKRIIYSKNKLLSLPYQFYFMHIPEAIIILPIENCKLHYITTLYI